MGETRRSFGEGGLKVMMRELQIHYTYRGPESEESEQRRGWGLGSRIGKHLEGQTTFGIQRMHLKRTRKTEADGGKR